MPIILRKRLIIASVTLTLLLSTGAPEFLAFPPGLTPGAQSGADSSYLQRKVTEWRTAVAQHSPGEADTSATAIAAWPPYDVEAVIKFITKLASQSDSSLKRTLSRASIRRLLGVTDQEVKKGDISRILKLGVLLHTDIALLELEKGNYQQKAGAIEGIGIFADGRMVFQPRQLSWQYARQLIDLLPKSSPHDEIIRLWYIATTAHMENRRLLGYAGQNLKYALDRFPSDDRLLFYAGVLHETWASPVNQDPILPRGARISYGSRDSELRQARKHFEKALEKNPGFAEARLRLGRVLGLLGDHKMAATELQSAAASITDPQLSYYACLYLGYEFRMLVRGRESRELYERAAMLYPSAQSPSLALSQLAFDNSDIEGALQALQHVFELEIKDRWNDDPWWVYDVAHVHDAEHLVAEMQKAFGETPR